jgi:hypothetical protein
MITGLLAYILGSVQVFLAASWTRLAALDQMIQGRFGILGKCLFWLLIAGLALLVVGKATKITFNILRLVLIPAAVLTIVLLMLVPCWSPMTTFPVLAGGCALAMLTRTIRPEGQA